ncbi:hypothetical protein ACFFRR_001437 [Megaselia abdita]
MKLSFSIFVIMLSVASGLVSNHQLINSCRGNCINEFLDTFTSVYNMDEQCRNGEDCATCWRYCKLIFHLKHSVVKQICHDRQNCTEGCKYVCKFYRVEKKYEQRKNKIQVNTKKECKNCSNNFITKYFVK